MSSIFIDCHCHIHSLPIEILEKLIKTSLESNVNLLFTNSTNPSEFDQVIDINKKYSFIKGCIGIHPYHSDTMTDKSIEKMKMSLEGNPNIYIGEIGLDRTSKCKVNFNVQKKCFKSQLDLAKLYPRPITIHSVNCYGIMYDMLKSHGPFPSGVIYHSYGGGYDYIKQCQNGLKGTPVYFSFGPNVYNNS